MALGHPYNGPHNLDSMLLWQLISKESSMSEKKKGRWSKEQKLNFALQGIPIPLHAGLIDFYDRANVNH